MRTARMDGPSDDGGDTMRNATTLAVGVLLWVLLILSA
jgi:hypothetical protein